MTAASSLRANGFLTWKGTPGTTANFETPTNWVGDTAPATGGTQDLAFDASTIGTIELSLPIDIRSLSFTGAYPSYTFSAATSTNPTLGIGTGGISVASSGAGGVSIASSLPLALTGNQTWSLDGNLTVNSVIAESGGAATLTKSGSGALLLAGANTYSGGTTISSGSLVANNASGSATGPGSVTIAAAATLQIGLGGATGAVTGPITDNGALSFYRSDPISATDISGSGTVVQAGSGTLTLTGTNTYGGQTFIGTTSDHGTLRDGAANAFSPNSTILLFGGTLHVYYNETIRGVGDFNIVDATSPGRSVVLETGTVLTLAGAGSTFSGVISGGGGLTIASGVLETLKGANTYTGPTAIAGTLTLGPGGFLSDTTAVTLSAASAVLDLRDHTADLVTIGSLAGVANTSVILRGSGQLKLANDDSTVFSGKLDGAPDAALVHEGSGTLTLDGSFANSASASNVGKIVVNHGVVRIGQAGTLNTGTDINLASGGTFEIGADQTIRALTGSGAVSLEAGQTLTVNLPDPDSDPTHSSSSFSGSLEGAGAFVKTGPGTLTLTHGSADFTGQKTLSSGTLRVTDAQALGTGSFQAAGGTIEFANNSSRTFTGTATAVTGNVTFEADRTTNSSFSSVTHTLGTVSIGGQTLTVQRGSHLTGASNTGALVFGVTTLAGGSTFNIGANALLTLGAVGDGGGHFGFTKSGNGTLSLAAANTFTGLATVSAGTVTAAHAGAIDSAPWDFTNDSVLETTVAGSDATHGVIATGSSLTFNGTAQLRAQKSYSITGGTQSFSAGAALVARDPDAVAGGTQTFTSDATPPGFTFDSDQPLADFLVEQDDTFVGDYLKNTARLTINSGGSVSGGQQTFTGTSSLQANTSYAITGNSSETFSDSTHLRASQAHAVDGGTQSFTDNAFLWATAQNAVSGGDQSFHSSVDGDSRLVAAAQNAVSGVTAWLYGDSFIDIRHDDALDASTNIYFSGAEGETGGKLLLNGHDTTVGYIRSGMSSSAGLIANDSESAATLTVDFDGGAESEKTFNGRIQDSSTGGQGGAAARGMIAGSPLSLVKQGTGTLVLTGTNTYTGGTTIKEGTLAVSGAGGSISHAAADLIVGETHCDVGSLSISDGGAVANKDGWIGQAAGSLGMAELTDTATQWVNAHDLFVGYEGSGYLKISGGASVTSNAGTVGFGEESMGSAFIDGNQSKWNVATGLSIGGTGSGVVLLSNGGTLSVNNGTGTVTLGASSGGAGLLVIGSDLDDVASKPGGIIKAATITTGTGSGSLFLGTSGTGLADAYYLTRDGTSAGTAITISGWTHVTSAAGVNILTGTNTYSGGTDILGGALVAQNDSALGNSPVHLTNAATLVLDTPNPKIAGLYDDSTDESFEGETPTGALKLTPTVTSLTISVSSPFRDEFSGPIMGTSSNGQVDGVSAAKLIKLGSGMLTLAGANSYSGGTEIGSTVEGANVSGGLLVAKNNTAFGTGDITVRAGVLGLAHDISLANNLALLGGSGSGNRAFIAGFGSVAPANHTLVIGDQTGLSPGAKLDSQRSQNDNPDRSPVGSLFIGKISDPTSVTFAAGGLYDWGVQSLATSDGTGSDLVTITGSLTFNLSDGDVFKFRLTTFDSGGSPGSLTGLSLTEPHRWTILTASTGITGFNTAAMAIDASGFANFSVNGAFSIAQTGNALFLDFNPAAVPEPSTWALLLTGLAVLGLVALRRRTR